MVYFILKQVHHTMQVLKYGMINPMILNLIYGHLDVLYIKCVLYSLHSKLRIWKVYIQQLHRENLIQFLRFIRDNFQE